MHDKPQNLQSLCIDALCCNVIAFCDQNFSVNLNTLTSASSEIEDAASIESGLCLNGRSVSPASQFSELPCSINSRLIEFDHHLASIGASQQVLDSDLGKRGHLACPNASLAKMTAFNDFILPSSLSNGLIRRLSEKNRLNDRTLTFFDNKRTRLTHVKIENPNVRNEARKRVCNISHDGLSILKQHLLQALHLINIDGIKLERLVAENLNSETVQSLKLLDLSGTLKIKHFTRFRSSEPRLTVKNSLSSDSSNSSTLKIPGNVAFLCKCSNLRTLVVAHTNFDDSSLTDICDHVTRLTYLDLSHTAVTDLGPLVKLRDTLTVLLAQKPRFYCAKSTAEVISTLEGLTVLDLSGYPPKSSSSVDRHKFNADSSVSSSASLEVGLVRRLAEGGGGRLKKLRILDISGGQAYFDVNVFSAFLETHKQLEFCGLLMSNACYFDCILSKSDVKVSGEADKNQVFTALQTYWSRDYFCSRSFYLLFRMLEVEYASFTQEDKDFCLKYIFDGLKVNLYNLNVQMAGTACLYNLCREDRAKFLHLSYLRSIVYYSLKALEIHATTLQLHKNVWLTLCNDHILQSGTFDMFRCCLIALESMVNCNEAQVTRITVAIVSILAAKIPTEWTARLGANRTYMKFLLQVVHHKNEAHTLWLSEHGDNQQVAEDVAPLPDLTLKFTLSALWNLTDESPATCLTFLEESGLEIVLRVLDLFHDHSIEAKVLGLLNNVAEVGHLKAHLVTQPCLTAIKRLLLCKKIDVSYFSAGILAHLCADLSWDHVQPTWEDCLELLASTVRSWEKPDFEMVAYRSFKPFFSLLEKTDIPAVQFWALWAIHHVCSNNRERYVDLFKEQHGREALEKVRDNTVIRSITSIMNLLQMASSRVPSADDLVPVLIYVVIKANPPYLLSTIQYVNAFIGEKLEGEDHYWWTQFSSAVTFIKTMDYRI